MSLIPTVESIPQVARVSQWFNRADLLISSKSRWQCFCMVPDPHSGLEGTSEWCRPLMILVGPLLQPHWLPPDILPYSCCSFCLNAVLPSPSAFLLSTPQLSLNITSSEKPFFLSLLSFGSPLIYSHSVVFFVPRVSTVINYESNYFLEHLSH